MRVSFPVSVIGILALAACGSANEQSYSGPDGEEVTVAREGDGTMTIRNEDGDTVITTGDTGGAMPGGLPAYPGADNSRGLQMNATGRDGGSGQISSFMTADAPGDVVTFYRSALESAGYEIGATMDMGDTQSIVGNRPDGNGGVQITATAVPGQGTSVSVIGGEGG